MNQGMRIISSVAKVFVLRNENNVSAAEVINRRTWNRSHAKCDSQVFVANDANGDGVLEMEEFRHLMAKVLPEDTELDDRQISSLYNEVHLT